MNKKLIVGGIALATCAVLTSGCGQDQDNTALMKEVVRGNESEIKNLATGSKDEVSAVVNRYVNDDGIDNKGLKLYAKSINNPETFNTLIENLTEIALNDPMFLSREDVARARKAKDALKMVEKEMNVKGITISKNEITLISSMMLGNENEIKQLTTGSNKEIKAVVDKYIMIGSIVDEKDFKLYVKSINNPEALNVLVDSLVEITLHEPMIKTRDDLIKSRKAQNALEMIKNEMKTRGKSLSQKDIPMMHARAVSAYKIEQALGNQRV